MRILDKRAIGVPLGSLGFLPEQLPVWSALLERPHGIILVTGPTGSGKSTTLYTSLGVLNDETRNIITIEDPIEYELPGVNQSQVNERIGVTFASGLRTIVRQDPDVIMVGEIRDAETAETAVQAALTGHLVLSTLHTNDAPGALVRLQNLGVEPFLISSSVIGVAGQRLVRKVCTACAAAYEPEPRLLGRLGIDAETARVARFRKGAGCRRCGGRGMKGRTAVYEVMPVSDELRDAIGSRAGSAELAQVAGRDGMTTLCEAGVRKALSGETTVEEVQRLLLASDVRSDGVGKVDPTPPAIRVAA
jgi:type IV pilus assembly protein PilB